MQVNKLFKFPFENFAEVTASMIMIMTIFETKAITLVIHCIILEVILL